MLEIILIVILSKRIALYAQNKGYGRVLFRTLAVLGWIAGEILAAFGSFFLFEEIGIANYLIAVVGAAAGMSAVFFIALALPSKTSVNLAPPLAAQSTASASSVPKSSPSRQWVCPACNYSNGYWAHECYNCNGPKPNDS